MRSSGRSICAVTHCACSGIPGAPLLAPQSSPPMLITATRDDVKIQPSAQGAAGTMFLSPTACASAWLRAMFLSHLAFASNALIATRRIAVPRTLREQQERKTGKESERAGCARRAEHIQLR
eukprot:5350430-Pleurochrysis_carterae.AAC.2